MTKCKCYKCGERFDADALVIIKRTNKPETYASPCCYADWDYITELPLGGE
jgi:hypothetical protein